MNEKIREILARKEPDAETNRLLGLLINFNVPVLRDGVKRVVLS